MELPKPKKELLEIMKHYRIATSISIGMELENRGIFLSERVLIKKIKNLEKHSPFEGYGHIRVLKGCPFVVFIAETREKLDDLMPEARNLVRYFHTPQ